METSRRGNLFLYDHVIKIERDDRSFDFGINQSETLFLLSLLF